jgi:ferritin
MILVSGNGTDYTSHMADFSLSFLPLFQQTKINENTTHVRHMTQFLEDFDGCYLPLSGNKNLP